MPQSTHLIKQVAVNVKRRAPATKFEAQWYTMFDHLSEYARKNGNCLVPKQQAANECLYVWMLAQRQRRKKALLTAERIALLDGIGFAWDPLEAQWEKQFAHLVNYKAAHGDCMVPQGYSDGESLGFWVTTQRARRRQGLLKADKVARLKSLGLDWGLPRMSWEERVAQLQAFRDEHGHCTIPYDRAGLGNWLVHQKIRSSKGLLTKEQVQQLDALGAETAQRPRRYFTAAMRAAPQPSSRLMPGAKPNC